MRNACYFEHLSGSDGLATSPIGLQGWLATLAVERHRRATPYIAQARALRCAASQAKHPTELERMREIRVALTRVSDVNFVEELVYRFLLAKRDALGVSMRDLCGVLAQRKLARALISNLALSGTHFRWQDSWTRAWGDGNAAEADIELYLRAISWKSGTKRRTAVFNLGVPLVKNNVDLCLFNCGEGDLAAACKTPSLYLALGELKGGIDPAGASEHWKIARTALQRIQTAFSKSKLKPHIFFIGAAIEKKMAREIWEMLDDGTLENAANLTSDDQVASISRWLCGL
jgi:Restriction endonuclease BsobI